MDSDEQPPYKRFRGSEKIEDSESFTPRDYQIEIFEAAKQQNTIVCLGTGTGKTFIAVMLIQENANEVRKPFDEGGKRIFFVAPTIDLVLQQAETIGNHTDLVIGCYCQKIHMDFWTDEFRKNEVLVMTPDIFKEIVEKDFIKLRQIKLLIIDECHHAVKDDPYRQVMKCFEDQPADDLPKVLGLTASLINGKCKPHSLDQKLKDLKQTLRSTVATANGLTDLQKYGTDPKESIVLYKSYKLEHRELLLRIEEKINETNIKEINMEKIDCVTFFDEPLKCLKLLSGILKDLGPWFACKAAEIYVKEVERLQNRAVAVDCLKMLDDIHCFLEEFQEDCGTLSMNSNGTFLDFMPHKVKRLLDIFLAAKRHAVDICRNLPSIQDFSFDQDPIKHHQMTKQNQILNEAVNFCSIVFVKQRITAYILYQWLLEVQKKCDELDFLIPEFVVGHGIRPIGDLSMFEKLKRKKFRDFKNKQLNVLIATRVLEEGIDIRQCNLVIRFDLPDDFRSYVQSKGRARAKNSNYVLLIEENCMFDRFKEELMDYKTIEKMLESKCCDRTMPTDKEISEHMADLLIPPYKPRGDDGPRITRSSAISLINWYCASLPSDMSTKLVPQWSISDVDGGYKCTLRMPLNSSLRQPIMSDPMERKKLSKMSAALKACQLLNEKGELDEHLRPISHLVDDALEKELGEIEEEDGKGANPGTKRRRQVYDKHVPIFLKEAKPTSGRLCYLNIINMMLVEPLPKSLNPRERPLFDPSKTPRALALLCAVKLPPLNPFPVFSKSGKLLVTVAACDTSLILTNQNIQDIEGFHRFIFSDALWLEDMKEFLPCVAPNSYYICPVIEEKIDWDFILATKQHPYQRQKLETQDSVERTAFHSEKFSDAVLMRSYKMNTWKSKRPTFHHVVSICCDLTPSSSFPKNSKYKTFQEYFFTKYNVLIQDLEQPLVETIQIVDIHMWKPLYLSPVETFDDKSVLSKSKQRHQNHKEYLVPELCIVHPFPSNFFFKVMCLPTVLFRLNGLLLAEEIRQAVAREAHVGTANLAGNTGWQPFHLETSNKSLTDYLFQIGELKEMPQNKITPCDIVKEIGNEITSFEVKIDLKNHTGPSPSLLLQALTAKSAGDEFDLERLEIIGDSFLKFSMSVKIFIKYPNFDEGKLTSLRSYLIQNLNLYRQAKRKKLGEYLITTGFNCNKTWLPPCYVVEELIDEKNLVKKLQKMMNEVDMEIVESENPLHLYFTKQVISDKCVADSVEALIGCYLLSSGQLGALKFMAWLGVNPFLDNETDFETWPPPPPDPIVFQPSPLIVQRLELLTDGFDRFEKEIGYTFQNKAYLLQAFTHPSYSKNDITDCYQRLEFLGDSLLDYMVTRQLYEDPAGYSPGKLTDLRSALVNNVYFAFLAVKHKYHKFLKQMSPDLSPLIDNFIEVLKESEEYKFFEKHQYYLEESECFDLDDIDVPKALGDVFESVAGAIYLDSQMSLDAVWKVYHPWIRPAMKHLCDHVPIPPVRELFELVGCQNIFGEPVVRNKTTYIEVTLPKGRKYQGIGPNKKTAKKSAAKRALKDLKNSSRMDTS